MLTEFYFRCCEQDKIHCSKRCSLSFIRIRTAFKATLALLAASIFWFVPQTSIVLDSSWGVLMIILVGISLSASHSLGGSIQSAKYLLASGKFISVTRSKRLCDFQFHSRNSPDVIGSKFCTKKKSTDLLL
jgi:hypothetical protein